MQLYIQTRRLCGILTVKEMSKKTKKHASKIIPSPFWVLKKKKNPNQSNIKLLECVTLCYSCPIKAKWIHKALLQQIRVISFFYLTYCMWWHIKSKENIFIFQLLSPFFTLYKILYVCVCYELLMSINMVQWSRHKLKKKGQQTDKFTRVHTFSATLSSH